MTIPTQDYELIFEQYAAAVRWMEGLGVKLNMGRTEHYARVIQHWTDAYRTTSVEEGRKMYPDFFSSIFEVHDFISIHKAFGGVPTQDLGSIIHKLQLAVNGPINAVDETPDSATARNILFEATVAAKVHRPDRGIEAILDARSDTGIRLDGKRLWVECKRVTSLNGIESNARKASRQLENALKADESEGSRGIVALDISKILNLGDKVYVARDDKELITSVGCIMDDFIRDHSEIWQRVYQRRHKKIVGTIIRFSFMATLEARNILVYVSEWVVNPRQGCISADEQVQRRLVEALALAS